MEHDEVGETSWLEVFEQSWQRKETMVAVEHVESACSLTLFLVIYLLTSNGIRNFGALATQDMTMLRFLTKKGLYLDATVERFLDVKLQLVGTMS